MTDFDAAIARARIHVRRAALACSMSTNPCSCDAALDHLIALCKAVGAARLSELPNSLSVYTSIDLAKAEAERLVSTDE